jgi:hypothetical protein
MPHRLSALVIALVVAVLPVTGVICEGMCTEHGPHGATATAVAHHHHTSDSPVPTTHHEATARTTSSNQYGIVPIVLRGCVQPEAVARESREVLRNPTADRLATTVHRPAILTSARTLGVAGNKAAPHASIFPASPLRI